MSNPCKRCKEIDERFDRFTEFEEAGIKRLEEAQKKATTATGVLVYGREIGAIQRRISLIDGIINGVKK